MGSWRRWWWDDDDDAIQNSVFFVYKRGRVECRVGSQDKFIVSLFQKVRNYYL